MPWLHSAALVVLNAKLGLKLRNVETGPNVLINLYLQQISCVVLKKKLPQLLSYFGIALSLKLPIVLKLFVYRKVSNYGPYSNYSPSLN